MPKIVVLYHYYRPDDVVSAQHIADLCEELVKRGWEVETWPANRSCHHVEDVYGLGEEVIGGVRVKRVWRPKLERESFLRRIAVSLWMEAVWAWRAAFPKGGRPDIYLTGTDPFFAVFLSPWLKRVGRARTAHWCFDMYPEYPIADGVISGSNPLVGILRWMLRGAYGACDLVADLGPCMADRLRGYGVRDPVTLTPWALEEPEKPLPLAAAERQAVFGKDCKLGLLYSGNMGRAHAYRLTLELARKMGQEAVFAYSARGRRLDELKSSITPRDTNIRFVPFAPQEKLSDRLACADIHLAALGEAWKGIAVPSKFFGSLAVGRPVLFEGEADSALARWIREHQVGWVLTPLNLEETAQQLSLFAFNEGARERMFQRCHEVYRKYFSKKSVVDRFNDELRRAIAKGQA